MPCYSCIMVKSILQYQVDCEWSEWSAATSCTKTCDTGKHLQTRTILTHERDGGAKCPGENIREMDCNTNSCPPGKFFRIMFGLAKQSGQASFLIYFYVLNIKLTASGLNGARLPIAVKPAA